MRLESAHGLLAEYCGGKRPDDFVFTAPFGVALRNRNWRRRSFNPAMTIRLLEEYSELTRLTPHDLRHTAASLAISAGAGKPWARRFHRDRDRDGPKSPVDKGKKRVGPVGLEPTTRGLKVRCSAN